MIAVPSMMVDAAPEGVEVYEPRGASRALFSCRDPMILTEGPAGTGKTRGIWEKIVALCGKYPGSRHLAVRQTRTSMTESVLVTLEDKVLGQTHPSVVNGPSRANRHEYQIGSSSIVLGELEKPSKTFSAEYDTVAVFEAIETDEGDVEQLFRTLRNGKMPYSQVIMDTNPGAPGHWLNQRAIEGRMTRLLSRHEDNPYLWDAKAKKWTIQGEKYIAILDALTGHRKQRLRFGKWVGADGVVYPEFDMRTHRIDAMPTGWQSWPKYRGIDFGYNDPFVCQWWAVNDGCMYLYREIYRSGRIVEEHARDIVRLSQGEEYVATVADHDKEDRMTLAKHGVDSTPAEKDIASGIDMVRACLKVAGNGKPRLFVLRDCTVERDPALAEAYRPTSTIEEFDCYRWKKRADKSEKDEPVDRDNHGMDVLRYVCKALQGGGAFTFEVADMGETGTKQWENDW